MARLSRRFSRYFSLSRTSRSRASNVEPKLHKSKISKPIMQEDTRCLITASTSLHQHTHSHSSSIYTISDRELKDIEDEKLGRASGSPQGIGRDDIWDVNDEIDDILAQYQYSPTDFTRRSTSASNLTTTTTYDTSPFQNPEVGIGIGITNPTASSPALSTSSSMYSSHSTTQIRRSAPQRFKDTPPPAPSWEKLSFGRQTRLFGPDGFVDFAGGTPVGVGGGRKGPSHKDWRGEFGKRGFAVL